MPASPTNTSSDTFTACTIIAKNYLAQARVLARSFKEHHPTQRFVVLLCDRLDDAFDPAEEPFELMTVEELGIPDFLDMAFRYTILELCTAVKPFFLQQLLREGAQKVLYFDPDILITAPLTKFGSLLDHHSVLLTPHTTTPMDDGKTPDDRTLLQAGAYNLGFLGIRAGATTDRFLAWWDSRLRRFCLHDPGSGLFVDQKWIDLAPSYFEGIHLYKDPDCNVAFWNMHERMLAEEDGRWMVNGHPLVFFHFSGYHPLFPKRFSSNQTRIRFENYPEIVPLFAHYRALLLDAGFASHSTLPYTFDTFNNGHVILPHLRRLYAEWRDYTPSSSNPFDVHGLDSFFAWTEKRSVPSTTERPPTLRERRHAWEPYQRFIRTLKRAIGPSVFYGIKQWTDRLLEPAPPSPSPSRKAPASRSMHRGVNVGGHLTGELGIGQAVRGHEKALRSVGIPCALTDITLGHARREDATLQRTLHNDAPFDISLIEVNAESLPLVHKTYSYLFANKYRIGHWAWELQNFPSEWMDRFRFLDEVWVASAYVAEGLAPVSPIPVLTMPYAIDDERSTLHGRGHFRLPADRFQFLFLFDFLSIFERKNPLGLIEAFRHAFREQEPVQLVLKFSNANFFPAKRAQLYEAAAAHPGIRLIDGYLSAQEVHDLIACSDAYVSLHRSEGFGLTLAEAMLLKKPVIGTDYSGSRDFLSKQTGFPVAYHLTEVQESCHPYEAGSVWANPDVDDAARAMRFVFEHPAEAASRSVAGAAFIRDHFASAVIGERMRERFLRIQESTAGR